jgi:3-oxoacyl-[acyl-carrier protein] reductase
MKGQNNRSSASIIPLRFKAGVIGMTNTVAKEMGHKGVNVNAIAPGMIRTDMMKSMPPETI